MATTTQVAVPTRITSPLALWHLLSLDAPTVAALWTVFIARAAHIHITVAVPAAMALAVWILYAADRLLDARHLDSPETRPDDDLEARHLFHHRHRRLFLAGIALAALALASLLPRLDPAAIRLYLLEGALLVAWFVLLHASRNAHRLPKEAAVGLFFSAAVFIPTVARAPALRAELLPGAVLFAALCSLNCLFIYAWEHQPPTSRLLYAPAAHPTTRIALAHLPGLALILAGSSAALAALHHSPRPIPIPIALAALLLLALHRNLRLLSRIHLRAAADLVLLTPILLLPFLQ